jgi:hypothetical protein
LDFSYDLGLVWLVNDRRISWWMLECAYIYISYDLKRNSYIIILFVTHDDHYSCAILPNPDFCFFLSPSCDTTYSTIIKLASEIVVFPFFSSFFSPVKAVHLGVPGVTVLNISHPSIHQCHVNGTHHEF